MRNIWDFVIDGLFVLFLISIVAGIAASSTSFNSLLYAMFGKTAHDTILTVNGTITGGLSWAGKMISVVGNGTTIIKETTTATAQVYPLATYIAVFALFIGAVLGIVVYAMSLISQSRRVPVAVPVRAA